MTKEKAEGRKQKAERRFGGRSLPTAYCKLPASFGFTLIETLVAITVLTTAIVAPMSLAARALASAFYARDQVAAFHLAQEAIEAVRNIRDNNILTNALLGEGIDLLTGIPVDTPFTIDTRDNAIENCAEVCPPLETDGVLFGYGSGAAGWSATKYTRTVQADYISEPDEIRISVTMTWQTGSAPMRTFTISENLYQWVASGAAQE